MYNASKHAVTVLCDGLRHELQLVGSRIKVSVEYNKLEIIILNIVVQKYIFFLILLWEFFSYQSLFLY